MFPRLLVAASLALLSVRAGAQPLSETAKKLSAAALGKGVARVAVLPLEGQGLGGSSEGAVLAERLVEQLVRLGRVRVVERSRLPELMAERRLSQTGATGTRIRAPGASEPLLQPADAVVTGSFSRRGEKMRISARLVHAESGEILAAVEETLAWESDSDPGLGDSGSWNLVVPSPEFTVDIPRIEMDPVQLRDAPREEDCSDASERVDRIEAGILDLKARYWAGQLRQGVSPFGLTRNPGSSISDAGLKKTFYDNLRDWYYRKDAPELTPRELERFQREDARAVAILRRCGL